MASTKQSEIKNPVHQDNFWRDYCRDEVVREARWRSTYGKFLVGDPPKYRETKEKPLRLPAHGRLASSFDDDIEVNLASRHIQRHARLPQTFSHHVFPKLESYQVPLPARTQYDTKFQFNTHLKAQNQNFEKEAMPLPKTENARYGWLAESPLDYFPGVGKPAKRATDLAKSLGIPYEAW